MMTVVPWRKTIASRCRYGDLAGKAFDYPVVIWENSDDDWQGFANFIGRMKDGRFVHYEWTYGSCSGCDEWEAEEYSKEQIIEIMRKHAVYLPDTDTLRRYVKLDGEFANAQVPSANSPDNGGIDGMLRSTLDEAKRDFMNMRKGVLKYLEELDSRR